MRTQTRLASVMLASAALWMAPGVFAADTPAAPVFKQSFETAKAANGVADGCALVGNAKITAVCSLDGGMAERTHSQKLQVTESLMAEQVGVATRDFALKAGKIYKISFGYKVADLNGAGPLAFLSWYDNGEKKFDNLMLLTSAAEPKPGAWTPVAVTFTPKIDMNPSAQLRLSVFRVGGTGTIWYDEFVVEEVPAK